jgi:hypothetical protein
MSTWARYFLKNKKLLRYPSKENGFMAFPQPDTYRRLFARRTSEKPKAFKKEKTEYIMFDPTGKFLRRDHTLKEAKHRLSLNETIFKNRYGQITKREIPPGSYILKNINETAAFNWDRPTIENTEPVAVKRCAECPNKTSTKGICYCGFWSVIRDSSNPKAWWPIHDRRMFEIRLQKEKKKVINVTVRLQDILRKK